MTLPFRTESTGSGIVSDPAGALAGLGDARHPSVRNNSSLMVQFQAGTSLFLRGL